jgi:hypothetical protein
MKYIPWAHGVMKALPRSIVAQIQPAPASFYADQEVSRAQVDRIKSNETSEWCGNDHPTIVHAILNPKLVRNFTIMYYNKPQ